MIKVVADWDEGQSNGIYVNGVYVGYYIPMAGSPPVRSADDLVDKQLMLEVVATISKPELVMGAKHD